MHGMGRYGGGMFSFLRALVLTMGLGVCLAGCATQATSLWGAKDDPFWSPRIGQVSYDEVGQSLGQPVERLDLPSGDFKVRWFDRPLTVSGSRGTMEDGSVQVTEERAYWRDMRFDRNGRLIRAWLSDQRNLADSEAP
jgi:hypothetical protein